MSQTSDDPAKDNKSRQGATLFTFTTRDWFWFCVVLFLAFGWGTHVRYSTLIEGSLGVPNPITYGQLQEEINAAREEANMYRHENNALNDAILHTLDPKQRAEIEKKKKGYYDWIKAGH